MTERDTINTPCGEMPNIFKEDYSAKTNQEICDLINGEFVDPFALDEMLRRDGIVLSSDGTRAEIRRF